MPDNQHDQYLLLIRHSAVNIDKRVPSKEWTLSDDGRQSSLLFAHQITQFEPSLIITSKENKAVETGTLIAKVLDIPVDSAFGLHEHDRAGSPILETQNEFRETVGRFFAKPDELVFGRETASEASARFDTAMTHLLQEHKGRNLAVITHGTVLTLYVSRYNPSLDSFTFWNRLKLPYGVLLRRSDKTILKLISPNPA